MRTLTETASHKHQASGSYIYTIVPVPAPRKPRSFVYIASDDSITHVDPNLNVLDTLSKAHESISCLIPVPDADKSTFATGGRDGKVKVWMADSKGKIVEKPLLEVRTPNGQAVSAIAVNVAENLLAVGTELEGNGPGDVAIYVWSTAQLSSPVLLRSYVESHTDTITSLRFHVQSSSSTSSADTPHRLTLISSSTDGLVNIYDPSISDEDDAVLVVFNNKGAVQHVSPFLLPGSSLSAQPVAAICAISHDEKMSIYEVEEKSEEGQEETVYPIMDVRESMAADYAISLTPRDGFPKSSNQLVLATGTYRPETLAKIPGVTNPIVDLRVGTPGKEATGASMDVAIRLLGAHGEELVRDVWYDETAEFVLTCGEDGYVRMWNDGKVSTGGDVEMEGVTEAKDDAGGKKKKRKEKRFKPY